MSANDVIVIGPFRYKVLKRVGTKVLVSWTEAPGIYKETWIKMKNGLVFN